MTKLLLLASACCALAAGFASRASAHGLDLSVKAAPEFVRAFTAERG